MPKRRKILITGATGFTGRYAVAEFLRHSNRYDVSIFARNPARVRAVFPKCATKVHYGDLGDRESFAQALSGQDILLNLASLGFGHCDSIVSSCVESDLDRALFVSSTSIYTHLNPSSKAIRLAAEERIRSSGLRYTIVRPTMIFGYPGDRNIERLVRYIARWPVLPVPGPGTYLIQPIYAQDLVNAFVHILDHESTIGQAYNLSGKEAVPYNDLVKMIAELCGRRCHVVHIPLRLMVAAFRIHEMISRNPKITVEQLMRLNEHKAFDHEKAIEEFDYCPSSLQEVLRSEVRQLL